MVSNTIGILGSNGFIGGNLLKSLGEEFLCTGITKDNYNDARNHYDILLNANGNSKKTLPEVDPLADFDLTIRNTMKSVLDFTFDMYIYISSCEVYGGRDAKEEFDIDVNNVSRYGFSKYLAECIVKKYCPKWLILRLNGPVGPGMRKGPVYDILNGESLWISAESQFQFIHVEYLSAFVQKLLKENVTNQIFNIAGRDRISLEQTMHVLKRRVDSPKSPVIVHDINVDKANGYLPVPDSLDSIKKLNEECK